MFKKLATLVCATAIATSAFTGIVANAALVRDQGINIVAERVDGADDQITLSVYAVGFDAIRNWGLNLAVTGGTLDAIDPEDYEADDAANVSSLMFNVDTDNNIFVSTGSANKSVALDDNLIFTATLSFTEDISNDITITLADESTLKKGDKKTLSYYESNDPEDNDLGFNDCVVSAGSSGGGETTVTVTPTVADSKAYVDAKDDSKKAVVGKVELEIDGGSYVFDRSKITYGTTGEHPTVTDLNDNPLDDEAVNALIVSATDLIVYIVINGTTDVAELDKVTFE